MRALPLLLVLAVAMSACDTHTPAPELTSVVSEATEAKRTQSYPSLRLNWTISGTSGAQSATVYAAPQNIPPGVTVQGYQWQEAGQNDWIPVQDLDGNESDNQLRFRVTGDHLIRATASLSNGDTAEGHTIVNGSGCPPSDPSCGEL